MWFLILLFTYALIEHVHTFLIEHIHTFLLIIIIVLVLIMVCNWLLWPNIAVLDY